MSQLCGSRRLAWLLVINTAAAIALWISMLIMHICGIDIDVLYSLFALPSGFAAFVKHPWTLVSYMFVHFSPLHLLFNMLWLFWFGRMLADVESDRTITSAFLTGGIVGGIAYVAASAFTGYGHASYLAGSSAAVLCLMCVTAVKMPDRRIGLFLIGEVKLKWVALACVLLTLIGGTAALPAQCAHIAGIAAGLLYLRVARSGTSAIASLTDKLNRKRKGAQSSRNIRKAMPSQAEMNIRLDELLDKIRLSGFDSLTDREKSELDYLSTVIKK